MLTVRQMVVEDASEVAKIHVRAWQKTYVGIMPQSLLDSLDVAERADRWRKNLSEFNNVIHLVCEKNGKIIGFGGGAHNRTLNLVPSANHELWAIYADPDHWGEGSGFAILKDFHSRVKAPFCVWVASENKIGHQFYQRAGGKLLEITKVEKISETNIPHQVYFFS